MTRLASFVVIGLSLSLTACPQRAPVDAGGCATAAACAALDVAGSDATGLDSAADDALNDAGATSEIAADAPPCGDGPACGPGQVCGFAEGCSDPVPACHPDTGGDAVDAALCACDGATFTTAQAWPPIPYNMPSACGTSSGD